MLPGGDGLDKAMAQWAARRGGIHQQIEFQQSSCGSLPVEAPTPKGPSVFAGRLCELYALGVYDAKVVPSLT